MKDYPGWVKPSTAQYCVAPGCRHKPYAGSDEDAADSSPTPRFAVTGTDLCAWHHARFPRILGDLVTLWAELEQAVVRRPKQRTNSAVQSSSLVDVASFWNPAASTVLDDLGDWAEYLARTVLREQPLPTPEVQEYERHEVYYDENNARQVRRWTQTRTLEYAHGTDPTDPPRLILAGLATHHARWLTGYPLLGPSWLQDALDLRAAALRALTASPVKRLGLKGYVCGHIITDDPDFGPLICAAPLAAILRPNDGNRPSEILCTRNPRDHPQLPRERWMEFAHGR